MTFGFGLCRRYIPGKRQAMKDFLAVGACGKAFTCCMQVWGMAEFECGDHTLLLCIQYFSKCIFLKKFIRFQSPWQESRETPYNTEKSVLL